MTPLLDRIERRGDNPNVVPLVERRKPRAWWERARAGELYGRDEDGNARGKDMTGKVAA